MAPPFYARQARQFHSLPAPHPPKGPPGIPVRVKKYIGFIVFIQLFAGTVGIFFLAVLAWKLGKFLRHFSRHKVVGGGQSPDTRYARTWYGWVPWRRHEANKKVIKKAYYKYRDWTSWKSTRQDYRWVWWDPGQKEMEKYRQSRRSLRWLPKWIRSYEPTPADAIWNPGPPKDKEELLGSACQDIGPGSESPPMLPDKHSRNTQIHGVLRTCFSSIALASGRDFALNHSIAYKRNRWSQSSQLVFEKGRFFWTLNHKSHYFRRSILSESVGLELMRKRCASLPCLASPAIQPENLFRRADTSWESEASMRQNIPEAPTLRRCSRKYQVWSARMQIQPSGLIEHKQCGLLSPPGSPRSEFLSSFASEHSIAESLPILRRRHGVCSSESSARALSSIGTTFFTARSALSNTNVDYTGRRWSSTPFLVSPTFSLSLTGNALVQYGLHSLRNLDRLGSFLQRETVPQARPQNMRKQKPNSSDVFAVRSFRWNSVPLECLSDWEVRLIDNLDRKLEWLLKELEPGRKPFHFATLANHWLNRKTWIVFDPVSRVSINARRQQGDPRVNVPYPKETYKPKPKYPPIPSRKAHTLKINSWRTAVNQQRRASGVRYTVKAVDLFDDSTADEPPDGKVDPACWILRKPPQGFAMSAKHDNIYYENGQGWQETFSDWQKVRRGYRIRKVIYEGRVNRNRVKQLARGISRYYRTTSPKSSTI